LRAEQVALRQLGGSERGAGQRQAAGEGGADGEGNGFPVLGHGSLLCGQGPGGRRCYPATGGGGVARDCRLAAAFTTACPAPWRGALQLAVLVSSRFS